MVTDKKRVLVNCFFWLVEVKYEKRILEFLELSFFNFRVCYNK